MKKTLSVVGLAAAVLVVALALTVGGADEALAGKKARCPAGTQKFVGVCIEKNARSEANFDTASADCADEAGRLPTGAELDAFRQQPGIELGSVSQTYEFTGDFVDNQYTLGIADSGFILYASTDDSIVPYRCVK